MHALRGATLRETRWGRGVVIVAAFLIILASGCCLFEDHSTTDHGVLQGLCVGMLALGLLIASVAPPSASGWALSLLVTAAYAVARHTPDPPPRSALSF